MQGHADPLHVGGVLRAVPEPLQGDDDGRRILLHLQRLRQLPGLEGGIHVSQGPDSQEKNCIESCIENCIENCIEISHTRKLGENE